jgi:hypothetical protein
MNPDPTPGLQSLSHASRVLLLSLAPLFIAIPASTEAQTMTLGPSERLYTNFSTNTTSDFSSPVLKDPANPSEVFTWTSNGQYAFAKFRGPLHDPQRTKIWSGYSGRWNFTGFPSNYRPWLGNIYKHTDGTLIGFVHIETAVYTDPNCEFRQGIAISTDNGDHWRYCGDVIKSQVEEAGQQNLGGCAVVKVGDYFYQYFNEYETGFFRKPAVARALIADVVAAAKNHTVTPWVKYYNGQWNRNALTEAGSSVLPYPSERRDVHGDAVYCKPLGKYLMVAYEQLGYDYSTPPYPASDARKGIYLYTSTDAVNWGPGQHVFVSPPGGDACYPYFGGITGASDDNLEVGSEFYIYVHDRALHELHRIPVNVTTPSVKRVLQIGDSNTEIGYITNGLRNSIIDDLGDQGTGYYPLNAARTGAAYNTLPAGFSITNDASWQQLDMHNGTRLTAPHWAPDGNWIESSTANATTTVQFNGTGLDIYWLARSSGGSFSVTVDGVPNSTVNTNDSATSTKRTRITGLASGNHTVLLKVVSGNVALLGVDAMKGSTLDGDRSVVHKFGNGWAATEDYLAIDTGVLQSAMALLDPTDVCIVLGTNDHNNDNRSPPDFQTNMETLIGRIQTALPSAKIWVVSTFETDTTQGKTTLLPNYVATSFPGAATATSSSYWNMHGWFGAYNAGRMLDAFHCNSTSGASIGQELYRNLTTTAPTAQASMPTFNPAGGTYPSSQSVAITTSTTGATVYYTTDGTTPTTSNGTVYTTPVNISANTTLKAMATRTDLTDSTLATATYYIGTGPELLSNTGFESSITGWSGNGLAVARITTEFHNGIASCRSQNRTANWNGPFQTIKTALQNNGPGVYTVSAFLKLAAGTDLGRIQIGLTVGGTTTFPTVTGTIQSNGWTEVTGTVNLDWSGTLEDARFYVNTETSTATLYVDDCSLKKGSSGISTASPPSFSPIAGTYTSAQSVTISSATPGAGFRYTVDGTEPTAENGFDYSTPLNITANTTLKAYATKSGMTPSTVTTATYTIQSAPGALTNGGFEDGTTGWVLGATGGGTGAFSVLNNQGTRDGSYALAFGSGNAAGNAMFTQALATTPGSSYTLGFQYGAYGSSARQQRLLVEVIDGTTALVNQVLTATGPGFFDPTKTTFQPYAFNFTASSTSVVLRFTDQTTLANSNTCDGMLDAVSLTPQPAAGIAGWRESHWPGISNPDIVGGDADPDGDGKTNLYEYALGLDPKTADGFNAVIPDFSGDRLSLEFNRQATPDITYQIEGSFNLVDWTLIWKSSGTENTEGTVLVEDTVNISEAARRFIRLVIY